MNAIDKAEQLIGSITPFIHNAASQTWAVAVQCERINAINQLVGAALNIVFCGIGLYILIRALMWMLKEPDWEPGMVITFIGIIGLVIGLACSVNALVDVWLWTTVFDPQLGLAHRLIEAAATKAGV
jgi:hypothetical protein